MTVPQIILGPDWAKVDGSLVKQTHAFLHKLMESDANPSLHIEPIQNSADPRARTGRVTQSFRAVLYKLQGSAEEAHYIFMGVFPHDDAIEVAKKKILKINPRNGIAELIVLDAKTAPVVSQLVGAPVQTTAPVTASGASLHDRNFQLEDLVSLGIDESFAAAALDRPDEERLFAYADASAPAAWQGSALLDLYYGESFEQIREKYELNRVIPTAATEDDQLLDAIRHPAARMEFAFIEDDDELRAAIENPNFPAWRVYLHSDQRRFVDKDYTQSFRITGAAGTGKTVVLLHRARRLHLNHPGARIVLTTFTRTLADGLKESLRELDPNVIVAKQLGDPGVYIGGIDQIASQILSRHADSLGGVDGAPGPVVQVLGPRSATVGTVTSADREWALASELAAADLPPDLASPMFLSAEYSTVILPNLITDRAGYRKVRRTGRGVALNRARRDAIWNVVEAYRAAASANGSADFDEKAMIAATALDDFGRPADHVLVDEAQDLGPSRLLLVRALAAAGPNDLFIAEDSHQRIYGQKVALKQYGINIVGASRRLTLNYRTTAENLRYALGILEGSDYSDLEGAKDTTTGYRSARSGPEPQLKPVDSLADQYKLVGNLLSGWLDEKNFDHGSIGLLVPTRDDGERLVRALGDLGVDVQYIDQNTTPKPRQPQVMTMHRSKGLEFTRAILVGINDSAMPRSYIADKQPEEDRADIIQRDRSLLYVAATRARDALVVTWVGAPSSLLPMNRGSVTAGSK